MSYIDEVTFLEEINFRWVNRSIIVGEPILNVCHAHRRSMRSSSHAVTGDDEAVSNGTSAILGTQASDKMLTELLQLCADLLEMVAEILILGAESTIVDGPFSSLATVVIHQSKLSL